MVAYKHITKCMTISHVMESRPVVRKIKNGVHFHEIAINFTRSELSQKVFRCM